MSLKKEEKKKNQVYFIFLRKADTPPTLTAHLCGSQPVPPLQHIAETRVHWVKGVHHGWEASALRCVCSALQQLKELTAAGAAYLTRTGRRQRAAVRPVRLHSCQIKWRDVNECTDAGPGGAALHIEEQQDTFCWRVKRTHLKTNDSISTHSYMFYVRDNPQLRSWGCLYTFQTSVNMPAGSDYIHKDQFVHSSNVPHHVYHSSMCNVCNESLSRPCFKS